MFFYDGRIIASSVKKMVPEDPDILILPTFFSEKSRISSWQSQ